MRYLIAISFLFNTCVFGQTITQLEYYFDTDPGFGNGISIPITVAADITRDFSIPFNAVSEGFHLLYVRAKSNNGLWSLPVSRPVLVQRNAQSASVSPIDRIEYFFDADPGFGNGTTIPITSAADLTKDFQLLLSPVTEGFHTLYYRAKSTNGLWSTLLARPIFVQRNAQSTSTSALKRIEYFFDSDPGHGNGTIVNATSTMFDQSLIVDLSSISSGFHMLYFRAEDMNGRWSQPVAKPFFAGKSGSNIVAVEYYYDDGITKSPVRNYNSFPAGKDITIDFAAVLDGLLPNTSYEIHITAINDAGQRSAEVVHTFITPPLICDPISPPITSGSNACGPGSITLTASGAIGAQTYLWYNTPTQGTPVFEDATGIFTTPSLNTTTSYYVAIKNGTCESARMSVLAQINPTPTAPTALSASACGPIATVTLNASGGSNGQYRWHTAPTGNTISGEVNSTFTTPLLSNTTTYYVSIDNGFCESIRTPVTVTIMVCPANQTPIIQTASVITTISGSAIINLAPLVSDPDNNLDLTSLKIIQHPISGAQASISNNILTVNYSGVSFAGTDYLDIEICDQAGACSQQTFSIEVIGEVIVYNGISANNDTKNSIFLIKYIDLLPETQNNKVTIYNRWGDVVIEIEDYDNINHVFTGENKNGNPLPSGIYFYKIEFNSAKESMSGYLTLKR